MPTVPAPRLGVPAAEPPGEPGPLPAHLPGPAESPARARPGDATSSFKEQTKVPVPGKGRQLGARLGGLVSTRSPRPTRFMARSCCGRGPAPRPLASSGNQPGLREPAPRGPGPGGWEWPSRLPSQGWGHPGAAPLSRSQNRGCNPGAEEGQAPSPTLKGTPSPGCPLAPRGPTQWAPGCGQRRQGSVPVSPMATHSGCSLWGPTCLS